MNLMENLDLLAKALEYMENHLREELRTEDVAYACFCSKSTLEKIFRYVNHLSVREYLIRRRMTLAGRELWENPDSGITDVALEYGYSSHEEISSREQIYSAMVVYGLLTYECGEVLIPNKELMDKFNELLLSKDSFGYVYNLAKKSAQMS